MIFHCVKNLLCLHPEWPPKKLREDPSPSRNKFTPTNTSISPNRNSRSISILSSVCTSLWMYFDLILMRCRYLSISSAIRLVSVVTSTRSPFVTRLSISSSRSSIWFTLGRISIGGSSKPVGRTTCSTTTPPDFLQFIIIGCGRNKNGLIESVIQTHENSADGYPMQKANENHNQPE